MGKTLSFYRAQGKEAFDIYGKPQDYCPYTGEGVVEMNRRKHWFLGWNEAKCDHQEDILEGLGSER